MNNRSLHIISHFIKGLRPASVFFPFLFLSFSSLAQTSREYQVKAVFLYNFSQFIEWPPAALNNPGSPFVIGILGEDPFRAYLDETVNGEKIAGHPIMVERYRDVKEIKNCHILFIGRMQSTEEIMAALRNRSILTVSDDIDFVKKGGMIRFFTKKNKIRLQINPSAARAVNLDISSKLLRVADVVE